MSNASDRAGRSYWDRVWTEHGDAQLPDPRTLTHVERSFAALFETVLCDLPPSASFLEIGCANSIWLPHFARRFGFRITGLDYSEIGGAQTRAAYEAAGLDAEIVCADAFSPPARLLESFDVVFTLGVVEHFDDTVGALDAGSSSPNVVIGRRYRRLRGRRRVPGWEQSPDAAQWAAGPVVLVLALLV